MKLYAQHGASQGDKTIRGIERGYIDGVIYSPRDITAPRLRQHIERVASLNGDADQFFDPQYYAAYNVDHAEARLGRLASCKEYQEYFGQRRRRELEGRPDLIREDINNCLQFQAKLDLTGLISPNIIISRSFDSIEAVIAKNFIREAGDVYAKVACDKPMFATLAVSREALMDKNQLMDFLVDITLLQVPADGFYVLVASRDEGARTDIFNADVIAGWLLIDYVLSLNGYTIINGFSDVLTPFLGAVGGSAGATGWWSNLRSFALNRYLPATGGRLPIQRYLSKLLLNRVTFFELDQMRQLHPGVLNGLETDALYPTDRGSEPERAQEVLQSWQALKSLCDELGDDDMARSLERCRDTIAHAAAAYDRIESLIRLDPKSNREHVQAIQEGLRLFVGLAELHEPGVDAD